MLATPAADGRHRICVIGSSHMVAYKLAADETTIDPRLFVHFQGLAGREFAAIEADADGIFVDYEKLLLSPRHLRPMWDPLTDAIAYDAFDSFVVVGTLRTSHILKAFYEWRTTGHFSRAYIEAGVEMLIKRDPGVNLGQAIHQASGKPVVTLAAPLTAIAVDVGDQAAMDEAYRETKAAIEKGFHARGLTTVFQPDETVLDASSTKEIYARASQTLAGVEHEDEERAHMNAAFGKLVLPDILAAAGAQQAETGAPRLTSA
ncbi:hypothetical protein L1787_24110 [Acuticoccus sp. M5D2P5]|uniref:hypothetical protein n=1 Tax=Acuticoccus kalidii TaxID=2910977 RepID=UPI001F4806BF|nr:hypothetical protein [Acuticoccus kalidii]MCF3936480.1 hypothetical protein [Acuticoccus kalidii]